MANVSQRSFGRGELAPALYARTDQIGYATGLRTCRNFQVMKSGGVENRPGLALVGAVLNNSVARLLPFVFSDDQAYLLEFTNLRVRFVRDGGFVGSGTPYTVSTPYLASELSALQITQSADVITIVHPNHPPADLSRFGDANWTYTIETYAPKIAPPGGLTITPNTNGSPLNPVYGYVVTAIDAVTVQESNASTSASFIGNGDDKRTLSWDAVAGASAYNIYKSLSVIGDKPSDYGFIGSTGTTSFYDNGITADILNRAPIARNPFVGAGNYPSAVDYYEGRRIFGGTLNNPQTIYTSRSADYNNFTTSSPSEDDDALTFTLQSKKAGTIRHLHVADTLLPFTSGGEWSVNGDSNGVLRPTDINAKNYAGHGCSILPPIQLDTRVLFVQARQAIVRDLKRDYFYGYRGTDLTTMSTHLFKGYQLVDWAYQENPESIVWCVRNDGVLLGLTDVEEQQMDAWHRHDTLGKFENVCVIPEGGIDAVYVVVNRNGVRYIERFQPRFFTDVQDCAFMDASLTYDGRNTGPITITISSANGWDYDEQVTLTASDILFEGASVGDAFVLTSAAGETVTVKVSDFDTQHIVLGYPTKTVPLSLQNVPRSTWARAVPAVGGLAHLEGQTVAVFADGYVVASPNNPATPTITVSGGIATLDRPYSYIHVGLPYVSDLETLDIDAPEGSSLKNKKVLINQITLVVTKSRGVFAGQEAPADASVDGLVEYKQRNHEPFNVPVTLRTGLIEINAMGEWKSSGHAFIRQVDPLPLSVLGIVPAGFIPPA